MVLKQKNPYWTAKAKEDLKEITKYYKKEISINMAHKKVKDLFLGRLAHQSLNLLNIIKAVSHFNLWYGCRYFDESVIHICYCLSDRCS